MRILFLINGYGKKNAYKGGFVFVERQIETLKKRGISATKIYCGFGKSISDLLKAKKEISLAVKTDKVDGIHAHYGSMTAMLGAFVSFFLNIPLIISFCGDDILGSYLNSSGDKTFNSRLSVAFSKIAAVRARLIIVKSRQILNCLPENCKKKAVIIPNGVDIDFFKPMDLIKCRKTLNIDETQKVVLFNDGGGDPVKNPQLAQLAIDKVKTTNNRVVLHTIGKVDPSEVPLILNAADLLLVTSFHEGSPNIVKEALACNLPIVSVSCGDVQERLAGVYPSEVVDYSPESVAKAIDKVLSLNIRSNGREMVANITDSVIADKVIECYKKIFIES